MSDPNNPSNTGEAQIGLNETLAKTRGMPQIEAKTIPEPPESYQPTNAILKRDSLRKLPEASKAEAIQALGECAALGDDELKALLGDVPPASMAASLVEQKKQSQLSKARLQRLVQYVEEKDAIINNDIVQYLEQVYEEYEHFAKKRPKLVESLPTVPKFFQDRGDAIKDGLARAKDKKTEEK